MDSSLERQEASSSAVLSGSAERREAALARAFRETQTDDIFGWDDFSPTGQKRLMDAADRFLAILQPAGEDAKRSSEPDGR
jgi:hypothetical protein